MLHGGASTVIEDMTGGLDVSIHTVFVISVEVCIEPARSSTQSVLDPCFAQHLASWWRVSKSIHIGL